MSEEDEQQAIQQVLESIAPGVLVRWVVLIDWMDSDENRWLKRIQNEGSTAWEGNGMMSYALDMDEEEEESE